MLETAQVYTPRFSVPPGRRRARVVAVMLAAMLGGCAGPEGVQAPPPAPAAKSEVPAPDPHAREQEARAMLAQAETDIQRARAKRALWLKAWESLVLARQSAAARDDAATVAHAKLASELAQLGLEQLAYPAVE